MKSQPIPGTESSRRESVTPSSGICLGEGEESTIVFSTPSMILLMELTAKDLLAPCLEPGEDSVGVSVSIEHLAPTPLRSDVRAVARLESIEKRQFVFSVEAFDAAGLIGRGTHTRAVIRLPKFREVLNQRHPTKSAMIANLPAIDPDRVRLERSGPVAHLVLNRPDKRNAIDEPMTGALEAALAHVESDATLRVLILSGLGRAFCAGEDIRENAEFSTDQSTHMAGRRAAICARIGALDIPVIARVHGACMGGGLMLALAADWIFSTPDAQFALPEIQLGWPPAYGIDHLRERLGFGPARDLCLLGKPITAQAAAECGLVSKVLPSTMMDPEIERLVRQLRDNPPVATAETRRLLRPAVGNSANLAAYARARAHPDAQSGMAKFLGQA